MDVETFEAIESLREDVGRVDGKVDALRTEMFESLATKVELAEVRDELRRHTAVLTESLRDDIRIVAEAVATMSTKLDAR